MKEQFEAALSRVVSGYATVDDADVIRQYVEKLEREIQSYEKWEASINQALDTVGAYIP